MSYQTGFWLNDEGKECRWSFDSELHQMGFWLKDQVKECRWSFDSELYQTGFWLKDLKARNVAGRLTVSCIRRDSGLMTKARNVAGHLIVSYIRRDTQNSLLLLLRAFI